METRVAKIIISHAGKELREVELDKDKMILGRKPHNDIVIAHSAVSGEHAAFSYSQNDVFVEDLGSTNGTFLNGRKVSKALLEDHDVVVIGKSEIEFLAGPRVAPALPSIDLAPSTRPAPTHGPVMGAIEVRSGANAGKVLQLVKPVTTLGRAGVQVIAITRQEDAYFFTHVDGHMPPLLNGRATGKTAQRLTHGDAIDLAGASMVFTLVAP